jgi:hypothetical protein
MTIKTVAVGEAGDGSREYLDTVAATTYTVSGSLGYSVESLSLAALRGAAGMVFSAEVLGNEDIRLTWDAAETAIAYGIYHDTEAGASECLAVVPTTTLSYTVSAGLGYSVGSLSVREISGAGQTIRQYTDGSSGDAPTGVTMIMSYGDNAEDTARNDAVISWQPTGNLGTQY